MTKGLFYLVDKTTLTIQLAGELPDSWANIPSINTLNSLAIADLEWAGYPNKGFLSEADARALAPDNHIFQSAINTYRSNACDEIWEKMKVDRDKRRLGGLKMNVGGKDYWFWTDEANRSQYGLLDSMALRNNLPTSFVLDNWKTMTGEKIPFTVALLRQVIDSGISQEKVIYNHMEEHYTLMLASPDPSLYDYTTGFPQTFDEYQHSLVA